MGETIFGRPQKPTNIPGYAVACVHALSQAGLGHLLSLGGAFGLLHYLDYRSTHDVDGWWSPESSADERHQVVSRLASTLSAFGEVRTRRWGEVVSVELREANRAVFSFQIAERSALLEEPVTVGWTDIPVDSLPDLIANKMNALVERGAPRDFRDVYAVCRAGLTTPQQCWQLWRRRQWLMAEEPDLNRAQLAAETHLERIEQARPLEKIASAEERADAEQVRNWYRMEFLRVRMD